MPIGTSKLGVLGAGVVPGGTQTFNASGTFSVPPGVSRVNITGRGGTGNPGNAGTAGNPGNPGSGGAGGASGAGYYGNQGLSGSFGGFAFASGIPNNMGWPVNVGPFGPWFCCSTAPPVYRSAVSMGGNSNPGNVPCVPNRNAQSGNAGTAGSAGSAGNPGNPGNASTVLCKTFPGGAGGNAGVAGAAGNGGSGGGGGGRGGDSNSRSPGSAGCSAGAGGSGASMGPSPPLCIFRQTGAGGGGGAGVTSSGISGQTSFPAPLPAFAPVPPYVSFARGGDCSTVSAPIPNCQAFNNLANPGPSPVNMMGGLGGHAGYPPNAYPAGNKRGGSSLTSYPLCSSSLQQPFNNPGPRLSLCSYNPAPARPNIFRAGAGGGASQGIFQFYCPIQIGGGGGGGGRGGAGNAGGNSSSPSGSAGTPQTFNCVSVTPGGSVPVTVGGPSGGQIVISWNPQ